MSESLSNTNLYFRPRKMNDLRRRWLIQAVILALAFHSAILLLASNYKVYLFIQFTEKSKQIKGFTVTSIPTKMDKNAVGELIEKKNKHSPTNSLLTPSLKNNIQHTFNSSHLQIPSAKPSLPQTPPDLVNSLVLCQATPLRITQGGLIPVGSVSSSKDELNFLQSGTNVALPPANFDLPSAIPGTLASEDLSSLEGAGRALGGIQTDDLPGLDEMARLFDPSKVQALETPQGIMLRMSNEVLFEFNSAQLTEDAVPILKEVAQILRRYAGAQVSVEGHTDTIGSADFNQKLSEQRALTVANWLNSQPAMVFRNPPQVVGYGESRPIVNPLGTREEQRQNRRVEIHIRAEKRTNPES